MRNLYLPPSRYLARTLAAVLLRAALVLAGANPAGVAGAAGFVLP